MPVKTVFQDSGGDHWQVCYGFVEYKTDEVLPVKDIPEFIEWLQYEYAKHKPEAKADDEGWIKWEGGKCPVDGDVSIDVKWGNGNVSFDFNAGGFDWRHPSIVAYRLHK